MTTPKDTISTVIPTLRYRDAKAAIDWLCEGFGFTPQLVVEDGAGGIAHAQLRFGNGMIMVGSARDDEFGRLQQPPNTGVVTQSAYLIVDDIDEHYTKAVAAGATITVAIKDEDYGGRVYSCSDPEGHLWNFGSYDPWQPPT
ncbi:MAG: VOC family protein [Gammaproteobacteria bacterium]|nr:VOC family protein [Gammaproteobacteria bacterium]